MSEYKIGTTSGSITALDLLATPVEDPFGDLAQYRKTVPLGDLTARGMGPRTITWSFPFLTIEEVDQLRSFISSSSIYIRSRKRNDVFAVFEVLMRWNDPREDGERKAMFVGHRFLLTLEFIVLSEVP